MAIFDLFTGDKRPSIEIQGTEDIWRFDASLSEGHTITRRWTSEPIEGGAELTDHSFVEQREFPIQVIESSAERRGIFRDRHVQAWARLKSLILADPPHLFTVTTTLESIEDAGLKSVSAPYIPANGNALVVDLVFVELTFSLTDVAENLADAAQDIGLAEVDLGSQGLG